MTVLEVKNLKKIYRPRFGGTQVQALSCVNFSVEEGEYVAIMGKAEAARRRCSIFWRRWISRRRAKCI